MYKVDESSQALYDQSLLAVTTLDSLKVEEHYILATTDNPKSLLDISRKQLQHRSLTNIPDTLFNFFRTLTEKCLAMLVDENMNQFGSRLFEELKDKLLHDCDLFSTFCEVVENCIIAKNDLVDDQVNDNLKKQVVQNIFYCSGD